MEPKADYLFEASWEVCNKVGGIYTVVSSKAPQMVEVYKDKFFTVGPYFHEKAIIEFQPGVASDKLKQAFGKLKKEGIVAYYGKWLIKEKPNAILLDCTKFDEKNKNKIKGDLWDDYGVDSLNSSSDFDDPVVWSTAVGKLLEELSKVLNGKIVGQFHEWLSGAGLLYMEQNNIKVSSVFTTHATVLGRTLAGNNQDLYGMLGNMNPDEEAKKYGVQAKHGVEKACAQNADVFTTVSEITAMESEHILGRKPDVLLPNGLDFDKLPNLEEIPVKHGRYKSKIKEFTRPFFFPYYTFDDENTLFYYISGRYEFRNKGLDVTISALAKLNDKLKKEKSERTIVVFFFIPAGVKTVNLGVLENKALFEDMQDSVDDELPDIRKAILDSFVHRKMPVKSKLFEDDFLMKFKKHMISFKKEGTPPLCTYELLGEQKDPILNSLRNNGLLNRPEDKVKIIFYPGYLSSSDRLLDMDYYPAVWGCHLGIFPSYYEPWGYTPLESAAYGVPAITSDLAGFGRFLLRQKDQDVGIYIIRRHNKSDNDIINQMADRLYWYASLPKKERIAEKIKAEHFAPKLDWSHLADNYVKAHNLAVEKVR
ncbi:glycogen/starch synthase [Candidatus Woesearchaeota archaeon]|nr:glycogen/starch synthase [Candidatus Woesearchaeota archaeon]